MKTLHFYTIGSNFTEIINDFIEEGSFYQAYTILKDGGMKEEMIKEFFEGKWKFEGDTREGDHTLSVVPDNNLRDEEFWVTSICTMFQFNSKLYNLARFIYNPDKCKDERFRNNVESLLKVYTAEEVIQKVYKGLLRREGWKVYTKAPLERVDSGVILKDGTLITCGYMEHNSLYSYLSSLGVVETSCWTDDRETLHISSGQINGYMAHHIESNFIDGEEAPLAQLKMLFDLRLNGLSFYGYSNTSITERILKHFSMYKECGAKFGNLKFLETFYPHINLPKFSKEKLDIFGKQCLRTSPKKSLAGLLNSKFDIDENSVKEMLTDWEKYKDIVYDNEFNYFYQEYIEGDNGVSLYEDKLFNYDMSKIRGDIVGGVKGSVSLSNENYNKLRALSSDLFKYIEKPIQLEFVVDKEDKLYIVQLRLIENFNKEKTVIIDTPKEAIFKGNSFSVGRVECDAEDVLIVDSEADSKMLIGKKALIVRGNPIFSHILALSACLKIPSMTGVEVDKLKGEVLIDTNREIGYILKL